MKLSPKLVTSNPWEAVCADLIGPYTLRDKDGTEIDCMRLTMIGPATSWFEIVDLPVAIDAVIPMDTKGQKVTKIHNNTPFPTLTNHLQ